VAKLHSAKVRLEGQELINHKKIKTKKAAAFSAASITIQVVNFHSALLLLCSRPTTIQ
jgi:hypothetical protein